MQSITPKRLLISNICIDFLRFFIPLKDTGLNRELYPGMCIIDRYRGDLHSVSKQIERARDIESMNGISKRGDEIFILQNHSFRVEFERVELEAP